MKFINFVEKITKKLESSKIKHELLGDAHTFLIAPTCTIHTDNCTIEVWKEQITVNEKIVDDLDDMIYEIRTVENS